MFLRDLHEFPTEGYVQELMALKLSQEVMLLYAFLGEIPILMVLLSRILNNTANKWANTIAVVLASLGILYTLPNGDLDEYFFAAIDSVAFILITVTAWRLPTKKLSPQY
jgi:hypothetical protein